MSKQLVYELWEFNQLPDDDSTYSERSIKTFTKPEKVVTFVKEDGFYGKCFIFDRDEWEEYNDNGDSFLCDIPEPVGEITVDSLITIEDFLCDHYD